MQSIGKNVAKIGQTAVELLRFIQSDFDAVGHVAFWFLLPVYESSIIGSWFCVLGSNLVKIASKLSQLWGVSCFSRLWRPPSWIRKTTSGFVFIHAWGSMCIFSSNLVKIGWKLTHLLSILCFQYGRCRHLGFEKIRPLRLIQCSMALVFSVHKMSWRFFFVWPI